MYIVYTPLALFVILPLIYIYTCMYKYETGLWVSTHVYICTILAQTSARSLPTMIIGDLDTISLNNTIGG